MSHEEEEGLWPFLHLLPCLLPIFSFLFSIEAPRTDKTRKKKKEEYFGVSEKSQVHRVPKRAHYDKKSVLALLEKSYVIDVGFSTEGQPFIIPMCFGFENDQIFLHGHVSGRLMKLFREGPVDICLSTTTVDGIVCARSLFHHSLNYRSVFFFFFLCVFSSSLLFDLFFGCRSVVIFGKGHLVTDLAEKDRAFRLIVEHMVPGRWDADDARRPSESEIKSTAIIAVNIEEASCKTRTGGPADEPEDVADAALCEKVWIGVIPLAQNVAGAPIPAEEENKPIPSYLLPKN